jgi:hypothetical protein
LPDRTVHLYRDQEKWRQERLDKLGNSEAHIQFWQLLDKIALGFWDATRKGIKVSLLPSSLSSVSLFSISPRSPPYNFIHSFVDANEKYIRSFSQ